MHGIHQAASRYRSLCRLRRFCATPDGTIQAGLGEFRTRSSTRRLSGRCSSIIPTQKRRTRFRVSSCRKSYPELLAVQMESENPNPNPRNQIGKLIGDMGFTYTDVGGML